MIKQENELKYSHDLLDFTGNLYNIMGMGSIYIPIEKTRQWYNTNYIHRYAKYKVNINPNKLKRETIYKKCSKTGEWYSGNNFMMTNKIIKRKAGEFNGYSLHSRSWKHDSRNMDDPINKAKRNKYIYDIQQKNLKFIKLWMYGESDSDVTCLVSGAKIKKQLRNPFRKGPKYLTHGSFYLHHFLVKDGVSILKETKPSELLKKSSLLNNVAHVQDLLGTILVNDDAHKKIHSLSSNSDLKMYRKVVIPYGLQSKSNYDYIAKEYPILKEINYRKLIKSLNF